MNLRSSIPLVILAVVAAAGADRAPLPLCWNYDNPLDRNPTVRREFGNSDAVVLGRVATADTTLDETGFLAAEVVHIAVAEVFKGRSRSRLDVFNENSSGRFPMRAGITYLLFAHWQGHGQYLINNCGNSAPADSIPAALAEVRRLSHRRRPSN